MSYNNTNKSPWGNKQGGSQIPSLVPFQQQPQVFQNIAMNPQSLGLNLQQMAASQMSLASNPIFQQQLQAVSYSGNRGLNPNAFQGSAQNNPGGTKQKVFTGAVTKIHENFGFIDDEVFFSRNVCAKGLNPVVGDRVLVEATFNTSMPFKWNASRVQLIAGNNSRDRGQQVEPVRRNDSPRDFGRDNRGRANVGERRIRSRDRDDDEVERKRKREDNRPRERDDKDRKSPVRRRSRSPKVRRRMRPILRYNVQVPKMPLNLSEGDLLDIKKRYTNLYIPSDFFHTTNSWVDTFPIDKPFALTKPCSFHLMYKEHDPVSDNGAIFEPVDADYAFSAKVMLMGVPNIEEIYQKCCFLAHDREDSDDRDYIHPTRLINFLVGMKAKNDAMAIGGPWSPSLDGANPDKDPSVLIKTAIRTCKSLTGIDLSNCTKWYRFVELYYRRGESTHKGKPIPPRVETVVIFLPDVWSCLPTRVEWEQMQPAYRKQLEKVLKADSGEVVEEDQDEPEPVSEEKEEEPELPVPTHHSLLNPKTMTVASLREELDARSIDSKGLKNQLVARLVKALKVEAENEEEEPSEEETKGKPDEDQNKDVVENEKEKDKDDSNSEKDKKSEVGVKKLDEVAKRRIEKQYTLPDQPSLIVHPSKTAKSGKFDCVSMSLSVLLDYRPDDAKEHAFEVYLCAELFNEMLMRDFGFNIYKSLCQLPDKAKEEDRKKKDSDDKKEKKEGEKDEKKDENAKTEASSEHKKDDKEKDEKEREDDKRKERETRRGEKKSDSSDVEDDDVGSRRKRRERVKLITKDKHLLLSFIYFDQSYSGFIFEKDLEELLYSLGLELSRSQVKKILAKGLSRDRLHYRQLTDKPKDEEKDQEKLDGAEVVVEKQVDIQEFIKGNKLLLPIFHYGKGQKLAANGMGKSGGLNAKDGLVMFDGAVVDVGKLLSQLDRSEKARIETERSLDELKSESQKLSEKYSKSSSTIKHLNSEVKEFKDKLKNTEDALGRSNAHSKLFQTTLMDIRDKIEPVLKTASHKDDKKDRDRDGDKKKDRDDGKSRWEKERDGSRKDEKEKKDEAKREPKDKDGKTEVKKDEIVEKTEVKDDVEMNDETK